MRGVASAEDADFDAKVAAMKTWILGSGNLVVCRKPPSLGFRMFRSLHSSLHLGTEDKFVAADFACYIVAWKSSVGKTPEGT